MIIRGTCVASSVGFLSAWLSTAAASAGSVKRRGFWPTPLDVGKLLVGNCWVGAAMFSRPLSRPSVARGMIWRGVSISALEVPHDHPNLPAKAAEIYEEYGSVVVRGLNKAYVEVPDARLSGIFRPTTVITFLGAVSQAPFPRVGPLPVPVNFTLSLLAGHPRGSEPHRFSKYQFGAPGQSSED